MQKFAIKYKAQGATNWYLIESDNIENAEKEFTKIATEFYTKNHVNKLIDANGPAIEVLSINLF